MIRLVEKFDANRDGNLSARERYEVANTLLGRSSNSNPLADAEQKKLRDAFDGDGDGKLAKNEVREAREKIEKFFNPADEEEEEGGEDGKRERTRPGPNPQVGGGGRGGPPPRR